MLSSAAPSRAWLSRLRRSTRMTRLCSRKLVHTANRDSRSRRDGLRILRVAGRPTLCRRVTSTSGNERPCASSRPPASVMSPQPGRAPPTFVAEPPAARKSRGCRATTAAAPAALLPSKNVVGRRAGRSQPRRSRTFGPGQPRALVATMCTPRAVSRNLGSQAWSMGHFCRADQGQISRVLKAAVRCRRLAPR